MKTIVTIKTDDGDIMSQFEVQPEHIGDYVMYTEYAYKFVFTIQNELSIPHTETHRVVLLDD